MVETLETSHTWSKLAGSGTVRSAPQSCNWLAGQAYLPEIVFRHLSHAWPSTAPRSMSPAPSRAWAGAETAAAEVARRL